MKIIEEQKRFSKSLIWKLQSEAYSQFGPQAWQNKGVPFYLTSNPLIAKQFACIIKSYLNENYAIDPSEPVYLFDIGAGSGRLAYLLLKNLSRLGLDFPFVYVMTDMVDENLNFWKNHPKLIPFLERGILDFAFYKNDQTGPLKLVEKGIVMEQAINPVILIGTYFFDTIPQDLFRVNHGRLEEGRITVSIPDDCRETLSPEWVEVLQEEYTYHAISHPESYFTEREANLILQEYLKEFESGAFLFPSGALLTLEFFKNFSRQRMLLLAADQGICSKEQLQNFKEPHIARHSSFSIGVNYHSIARYFELHHGLGLLPVCPDHRFAQILGIMGEGEYRNTCALFHDQMESMQPVDYWHLTELSDEQLETLTLRQLLVMVKIGNYDPLTMNSFVKKIEKEIPGADDETQVLLKEVVMRCLSNFYFVSPSEGDFVMNMGVLLFLVKDYRQAMEVFQHAASIKGMDPVLMRNLAICQSKLHRPQSQNLGF